MPRLRTDPDALVIVTTDLQEREALLEGRPDAFFTTPHYADLQEREALLEGRPDAFFTTPHYDGYPAVLVHLDPIEQGLLTELVEDAWRTHALKRHLAQHEAAG